MAPEARRWGVRGTLDYLWSLVETMMEVHDRLYIEQKNFGERTIAIDTLSVGTTEFDLSKQPQRVRKLYESGRAAAEAFLEDFDYEEHLRGPEGRGKGVEIRPNWRLLHAC
jgi:predicted acylesterase/phospholipase RssA